MQPESLLASDIWQESTADMEAMLAPDMPTADDVPSWRHLKNSCVLMLPLPVLPGLIPQTDKENFGSGMFIQGGTTESFDGDGLMQGHCF